MKLENIFKLLLLTFLVGVGVSAYLLFHHYELINGQGAFHSFCSINSAMDCDAVNSSKYSEIFGIPTSALSLGTYLFFFVLTLVALSNRFLRKECLALLMMGTGGALLFSITMAVISAVFVQSFCLFCGVLYVVAIVSHVLTILASKSHGFWKDFHRKKVGIYAMLGFILLIAVHGISRGALYHPLPINVEEFRTYFSSAPQVKVDIGGSPLVTQNENADALEILEFADFQCPTCALAARKMHHLLSRYRGKVKLAFKNFPLDSKCNPNMQYRGHLNACLAASAAFCANKQGKFRPMYELMFENQGLISQEQLMAWAKVLQLDENSFSTCLESEEAKKSIQADIALGGTLGVRFTPTFFVQGRKVEGPIVEEQLSIIFQELKK